MDHNYLVLAIPPLLFALAASKIKTADDLPDIIKNYLCRVCSKSDNDRELLELSLVEMDEIKEQLIELTETIQDFVVRNPDIFSKEE
mgnify:FL=1|tara:strand:- start:508 stop:768 length:261 start_codon:yes stop_codon:yes gene_type:complete